MKDFVIEGKCLVERVKANLDRLVNQVITETQTKSWRFLQPKIWYHDFNFEVPVLSIVTRKRGPSESKSEVVKAPGNGRTKRSKNDSNGSHWIF